MSNPTYPAHLFRWRFILSQQLFHCVANNLEANEPFFTQHMNIVGLLGFHCFHKVTMALWMITYDTHADITYENIRMVCFKGFVDYPVCVEGRCNPMSWIYILEVFALKDLWIWHCYFGLSSSHNDINVLQTSHLFVKLAGGDARACNFKVYVHEYGQG